MAWAHTRTLLDPDRPSHTHPRVSPSVLPQDTHHRRNVERTSFWRAERRVHRRGRPQSEWRGRKPLCARAAALAVVDVITTAAQSGHVEHVRAARRHPVRACAAVLVVGTLEESCPVTGPPMLRLGAAGEPLQRSA